MQSENAPTRKRGWFKATASATNSCCVEVLEDADTVFIRDSKWAGDASQQPIISVSPTAWTGFLSQMLHDG